MAGPWFTVQRSGDDWAEMGRLWISNGKADCKGRFEVRLELEEVNDGDTETPQE